MQRILRLLITGLIFVAPTLPALANGSAYTPGAMGGIEFRYTEGISIKSEVLHIRPDKINVSYQFFSKLEMPVELDIAFPVFMNNPHGEGDWILQFHNDDAPFLGLQVLVDGEEIEVKPHFSVNKVDVTHLLTEFAQARDMSRHFSYSEENIKFLKGYGIDYECSMNDEAPDTESSEGKTALEADPCWIKDHIDLAFIWQQDFQPGLTHVEVSYEPETGGDYYLYDPESQEIHQAFGEAPVIRGDERGRNESYREVFCMDQAFIQAVRRESGWTESFYSERNLPGFSVVYIWDTARYWQGPIENFHLIIDKTPGQIISYCPPVGTKTSPTRFEWKAKNFVPQGRLQILYLILSFDEESVED